jgi:serine/threonine protein kinase/Tfp pilus assembly protein PilF
MKNERWQEIEQLYHAALQRDANDRAAFLVEACKGDEKLRRELESLLKYEERAEHFIESPALDVAAKMMADDRNPDVMVGQTINQYKILRLLGAGGMGEVYLADDTRLHRKVAIKFLPADLTQHEKYLRRFLQEAYKLAKLTHPNVCTIHDVIQTGQSRHCIVMEYVDGVNLRDRIATDRMTVSEALDVALQVASALQFAHANGIVHRDIKLENIMLRRDGYVKILDFGLAKLTEREISHDSKAQTRMLIKTSPGVVMGTVYYMSPEQARGLSVDARTDVWSLGVVLYELVTGKKPFEGPTPTDIVISIAEREPAPMSNHVAGVPARLEEIVSKALAKDREQRYRTAEDLLTDLKSVKQELEIGTEVQRFKTAPAVAASRQSPNFLPLLIIAGVLIVAVASYILFFRKATTTAPSTEIKSLAVLPLENLSGDSSQDYFADGMTDSLITDLARIGALRVTSRPLVMPYKNSTKSVPEIGRELSVDAVLKGSVQRSGEQVNVAVQLINAATNQNLWTNTYARNLSDVLALQKDVTRDLVNNIHIQVTTQEQAQLGRTRRPVKPEAYDHYLRGQFYLHRQNRENNELAINELEQAVNKDPEFAAALAELAQAYVWKLYLFAPEDKQSAQKAFVAARKALDLDPDLAVAYLARGRLMWTPEERFPHERVIREYRHALTLDPNLDEARNQLALVYCHIGAFDDALREAQRALATNPTNPLLQFRIGETLNFQRKHEAALTTLRAIPKDANPALVSNQTVWALFSLGRREEASATLEQFLKENPQDNRGLGTGLQALLAASMGQERVAEEKIKLAIEKGKGFGHFHHTAYHIASAYALMKKNDQAIKFLEAAASDGFPCYPLFETDPTLNNLRQDARFISFLATQKQKWEDHRSKLGLS